MSIQNYLFMENSYQPINIIAGAIPCTNCSQLIKFNDINDHLINHISIKYHPDHQHDLNILSKYLNPMEINQQYNDQQNVGRISINSLNINDLPEIQNSARKIANLQPLRNILDLNNNIVCQTIVPPHDLPLKDKFIKEEERLSQQIEQQKLKKQIKLTKKYEKINHKKFSIFQNKFNIKSNNYMYLNLRSKAKSTNQFNNPKKYDKYHYQITQNTQQKFSEQSAKQIYHNQVSYDIGLSLIKNKPIKKISTLSYNKRYDSQKQNLQPEHDKYCEKCDGFYCKYCGSTVPPQYRSISQQNKYQHQICPKCSYLGQKNYKNISHYQQIDRTHNKIF